MGDVIEEPERRSRRRWIGWTWRSTSLVIAVAALLGLALVQREPDQAAAERPARVLGARVDQGRLEILVELAGCHLHVTVSAEESAERVEARARVRPVTSDLECRAVVSSAWTRVRLHGPLATRQVFDAWTGEPVPVLDCHARLPDHRCRGGAGAVS